MRRVLEYMKRGVQMVVGAAMFDIPILISIRHAAYRMLFTIGKGGLILRHVSFTRPHPHMVMGADLVIGDDVRFNHTVEIDYSGGVTIENDVWFSQNILIETHEHVYEAGRKKEDWEHRTSPLVVREGAWIGANVVILGQVREIGSNAIVGAGSVVTRDVEPNCIVGGNPARKIKDLGAREDSLSVAE